MLCIVVDGVGCAYRLARRGAVFAGVQVPVESGNVAGGPNIDSQFISLSRVQECGLFLRIAIAGANNAFGEVLRGTVRRNVDELGGEVGVHGGRARVKIEPDRTRDLEILSEGRSGVDENIVARLEGALVARSGL